LQEPPESAPLGIVAAPLAGTLLLENTLFTSGLPQTLQVTPEISEETRNFSNILPHSLQENLYVGILFFAKEVSCGSLCVLFKSSEVALP
jgi:hypothetical protein